MGASVSLVGAEVIRSSFNGSVGVARRLRDREGFPRGRGGCSGRGHLGRRPEGWRRGSGIGASLPPPHAARNRAASVPAPASAARRRTPDIARGRPRDPRGARREGQGRLIMMPPLLASALAGRRGRLSSPAPTPARAGHRRVERTGSPARKVLAAWSTVSFRLNGVAPSGTALGLHAAPRPQRVVRAVGHAQPALRGDQRDVDDVVLRAPAVRIARVVVAAREDVADDAEPVLLVVGHRRGSRC